jgi:predicted nuclease with TOPRIM domain
MSKRPIVKSAARSQYDKKQREIRETKQRLRRIEKDQAEISRRSRQLRASIERAESNLESLREYLNGRSAEQFAAGAERELANQAAAGTV